MLSHLRFHRRGHSNPSSPYLDQPPSPSFTGQPSPYLSDTLSPPHDGRPPSSGSSNLPPTLPPITRVSSADGDLLSHRSIDVNTAPPQDARSPQPPRSPYTNDSGFIGGVALRNYRRDLEKQAASRYQSLDNVAAPQREGQASHAQPRPPPSVETAMAPKTQPTKLVKPNSYVSPTSPQMTGPAPAVGKRPAGTRLATEPPSFPSNASAPEPSKGKKSLPFLKNPMSGLLMRRKNNQNVPDILPLPLRTGREEPVYDPRIRGTRVHDFSAPRRKNNVAQNDSIVTNTSAKLELTGGGSGISRSTAENPQSPDQGASRLPNSTSEPNYASLATEARQQMNTSSSMPLHGAKTLEMDAVSLDDQVGPPVPPKDDTPVSSLSSSRYSHIRASDASSMPRTNTSIRSTLSKKPSLSDTAGRDPISSLPRHMKSTSSRFSFDMIGAAKQEKLLEDRHRQRFLDKNVEDEPGPRDSRYDDDFDEDAFDYDAMMEDDGFEEEIPEINMDYGVDDFLDDNDPNNDQENFAGFVFSRSNPASSLASPRSAGMLVTPRDAEGRVIGFAMTQGSPDFRDMPVSPLQPSPLFQTDSVEHSGLGIHGMDFANGEANAVPVSVPTLQAPTGLNAPPGNDDLYFDGGLTGYENEFAEDLAASPEWDTAPFDESIFDNNDTDQYGRPVPGAFAQAQSLRQQALQEGIKRDSDVASRLSGNSAASRSTAHTSVSVDPQKSRIEDPGSISSRTSAEPIPSEGTAAQESVAAYQAALAAAAYQAAASGKFQRQPSPPREEDEDESGDASDVVLHQQELDNEEDLALEDSMDPYSYDDMDDEFDMDDDAIIAEANASALANDSDGWYGQEFGFYANPINQQHTSHNSSASTSYEYANGGFFGPKGMPNLARTMSGRLVSREPNLTPITERSEYSNRNSMMSSLGGPGFGPGTPIQSPGLAQLAMMAERGDDQMSLSALLKLRSKAWGGSQASLSSSREGSPRSEYSPWGGNPPPNINHHRKNSVFSTMSRDSEAGSISGSPTLTMNIPMLASPPPPLPSQTDFVMSPRAGHRSSMRSESAYAPALEIEIPQHHEVHDGPLSAVSEVSSTECQAAAAAAAAPTRRPGMGHRHKGSADSISYMKEEDSGETRWVMERRRTAESGEVEILEREIVEGGRI